MGKVILPSKILHLDSVLSSTAHLFSYGFQPKELFQFILISIEFSKVLGYWQSFALLMSGAMHRFIRLKRLSSHTLIGHIVFSMFNSYTSQKVYAAVNQVFIIEHHCMIVLSLVF